jgi:cytochrome c
MRSGLLGLSTIMAIAFVTEVHADSGGDPAMGRRLFAPCSSCHTTEANVPAKLGPTLHGIFGRKAGSLPGFSYSEAMQKSGIVWNESTLDAYIKEPSAVVPGNKMLFSGVPKDQARADIIAYLKQATK